MRTPLPANIACCAKPRFGNDGGRRGRDAEGKLSQNANGRSANSALYSSLFIFFAAARSASAFAFSPSAS
jgi:hypothetical protein